MSSSAWPRVTIESLIASGAIVAHKDGNYGSLYPRVEEFGTDGVPFLTAKSLDEGRIDLEGAPRLAEQRADTLRFGFVRTADVLLSHNATIGRVAVVPQFDGRLLVGTSLTYFRLNSQKILPRYFAAYLAGADFQNQLAAVMSHSTRNQVPITAQRTLSIVVPPLDVQHMIADTLGSLDAKIEQNRRTGRALEGLARATFKAWFVDFEPVKTKAAGAAGFPGMSPAAFAALPDRLTDSPLGPVPEGWAMQTVGAITTLSKQQIDPQDHAEEFFEHFSLPAYDAGQNPVVEPGSGIMSQKFVVVPGCVLLSKLNPRIPRIWLPAQANRRRQIASTEFLVAVPRPGWTRESLYCLFQQGEFRESLIQSASGTSNSHQRVRPSDLLARPLVVPPRAVHDAFADQVIPQMALREALHAESAKLAALRDYLLSRLLSGRVRVRPLQAEVKAECAS